MKRLRDDLKQLSGVSSVISMLDVPLLKVHQSRAGMETRCRYPDA